MKNMIWSIFILLFFIGCGNEKSIEKITQTEVQEDLSIVNIEEQSNEDKAFHIPFALEEKPPLKEIK